MKKIKRKNPATLEKSDCLEKNPYVERIKELKELNDDLAEMLEDYRRREKAITDTLSYIEKQREEVEKELRIRYELETERLCAFRTKWTSAVRHGTLKNDYERTEKVLEECRIALMTEFDSVQSADYLEERERLNKKLLIAEKEKIDVLSDKELQDLLDQL